MNTLKIIAITILLSIGYGILHDLIAAHISVEYFTIGHPKIIESESPIKLAFLWGVIATWWVGLILGILLSFASQFGKAPQLSVAVVVKWELKLLVIMAALALVAGLIGYLLAENNVIYLVKRLAYQIPVQKHNRFLVAGWSHGASYLTGFVGGIVLSIKLWRKRKLAQ